MKDKSKRSLKEFFEKRGFYVVLVLCIIIVGATAVVITLNNYKLTNQDYNLEDDNFVSSTSNVIPTPTVVMEKATLTSSISNDNNTVDRPQPSKQKPTAIPITIKPKPDNNKQEEQHKVFSIVRPVYGQVGMEFSTTNLVYSKTLNEWVTHMGLDIFADVSTPVQACFDGVVTEIKNDPGYGLTIVIEHNDGFKSVYCNLSTDKMVSVGQKVNQGQAISGVGKTATFESLENSHLHFEILKDNVLVDPKPYLK